MNLQLIKANSLLELKDFNSNIKIETVSIDLKLYKLHEKDYLPRFHKVKIKIRNDTKYTIENLILRVDRIGSKIGGENFDILPITTYTLLPSTVGKYALMIFDPFNEKFISFSFKVADEIDWQRRQKVDKWLNQASDFSKRIK